MSVFSGLRKPDVARLREKRDATGLWKVLRENDPATRGQAKQALVDLGAPAVPVLLWALVEPDKAFPDGTSWHSKARRVLDLLGPQVLIPELAALAQGRDPVLRSTAISQLLDRAASDPVAARALLAAAADTEVPRLQRELVAGPGRERAARVLLNTGEEWAVDEVVHAVGHTGSYRDRLALALALAECGDVEDARVEEAAQRVLDRATRLMDVRTFAGTWDSHLRPGPLDPRLRDDINKTSRLHQCGVQVTARAAVIQEDGQWVLVDGDRRYLLRASSYSHVFEGSQGDYTLYDLRLDVEEGDPLLAPLRRALRNRQARRR